MNEMKPLMEVGGLVEVTKSVVEVEGMSSRQESLLNQLQTQWREALLSVEGPVEFLRFFIKPFSPHSRAFSYAEFSRRAGFSSRSFPREVCLGRRSINFENVSQFIRAMGLTGEWKEFFQNLVQLSDDRLTVAERNKIKARQFKLNAKLQKTKVRTTKKDDQKFADQVFAINDLPRIFASLGKVDVGESLEEISKRTRIKSESLLQQLNLMVKLNLVTFNRKTQKYLPMSIHHAVVGAGQSHFFRHYYIKGLHDAELQARKYFASDEKLFLQASFSVRDQAHLKQLKNELREIVFKFIEDNEDSEGSLIADLNVGLFDPSQSI